MPACFNLSFIGLLLFSSSLLAQEANLEKHQPVAGTWNKLINEDLSDWIQKNGTAKFVLKDGVITGTTATGSPNSFLCTKIEYGDFELTFDVKVHDELNSGVQIRSKTKDSFGRVFGPQVEIEASGKDGAEAGYVYGEATGRGWLTPKKDLKPHKHFNDGKWNSYRVVAVGPQIQTWVNGKQISDLADEAIYKSHPEGFIGLQVHSVPKGKGPFSVSWRNIKVRERKSK